MSYIYIILVLLLLLLLLLELVTRVKYSLFVNSSSLNVNNSFMRHSCTEPPP
jgi:hypothetical protein